MISFRNNLSTLGRTFWPSLLGVVVVLFAVQLSSTTSGVLDDVRKRLEWLSYDLRMNLLLPDQVEPDERVIIVDVDERSLQQEGHWPWPREKLARMTETLFDAGAAVVGYDIVFPESAPNPALRVLDRLRDSGEHNQLTLQLDRLVEEMDGDRALVESVRDLPVVLGFVFEHRAGEASGVLPPEPVQRVSEEQARQLAILRYNNYTGNIPQLQEQLTAAGFFNTDPDADGVIRRSPLVALFGQDVYPALSLEMVRRYLGDPPLEFRIAQSGDNLYLEGLEFGPELLKIPTNNSGEVFVPFRGQEQSYRYISATDVLHGQFERSQVRDALILVGTSAAGLFDLRSTPVDKVYPGVEVHANLISAMLDEDFPIRTTWAEGVDLLLLIGFGLLFALLFPHLRPIWLLSLWLVASLAYILLNFWLWQELRLVTSLSIPLVTFLALTLLNMTWGYLLETRSRARLSNMFGQYVPAELVNEMNRNPDGHFGFEGESRDMTVLFCDIRNFTSLSEALPANQLKAMLNEFFTPMTRIIFQYRGTVDKYVGDMIMAFWSAPLVDPDHRSHGVQTALEMLAEMNRLEPVFDARGWPQMRMGIGLNSGMMNVGDMGSEYRRAYTVLGDTVNMASRFEGLTKYYAVQLLVGEETLRDCSERFVHRVIDRVKVKGKSNSASVFEPLSLREAASESLLSAVERHNLAMELYFARDWDAAHSEFEDLRGAFANDHLYDLLQQRIRELRQADPGPDWDGAFVHTEK